MLRLAFAAPAGALDILAIGAHADDIEIGCGGTLLRLIAGGQVASVRWVVLSGHGERADEARAGADRFLRGVAPQEVAVHAFRDGYFPYEGAPIKDVFEALKSGPVPDLVLTHRREDAHQDHRFVADLTWQTFRDHLVLEYEIPKYEGDLGTPNVYVDLPEAICRRKVELLHEAFPSQAARPWFDAETFWGILRLRGTECRAPSRFAEAFTCRKALIGKL
jgi:LmbE family N-acetylglucosaminyl deacetylase